jgi:cytidyltransferase-like protein
MVLASGVFDGLHAGHVAYLHAAATLCEEDEPLVVAVAPDAYIRQHKDREPFWSVKDRMRVVAALAVVDEVCMHEADGVAGVILANGPRLLVKGEDWRKKGGVPADVLAACEAAGTVVAYVEEVECQHTSEIMH